MRMMWYGMLGGLGFLLALAVLEIFAARPEGTTAVPRAGGLDAQVSDQRWAVLAEARRIVEEGA